MKSPLHTTSKTVKIEPAPAIHALPESKHPYTVHPESLDKPVVVTMILPSKQTPQISGVKFEVKGAEKVKYTLFKNPSVPVKSDIKFFHEPSVKNVVDVQFIPVVAADYIVLTIQPASLQEPVVVSHFVAAACFEPGIFYMLCVITSSEISKYILWIRSWRLYVCYSNRLKFVSLNRGG